MIIFNAGVLAKIVNTQSGLICPEIWSFKEGVGSFKEHYSKLYDK